LSTTADAVEGDGCEPVTMPHSMAATIMGEYAPGRRVPLEVDIMARYLERLLPVKAEPERGAHPASAWRLSRHRVTPANVIQHDSEPYAPE
jgi:hypothetical protein